MKLSDIVISLARDIQLSGDRDIGDIRDANTRDWLISTLIYHTTQQTADARHVIRRQFTDGTIRYWERDRMCWMRQQWLATHYTQIDVAEEIADVLAERTGDQIDVITDAAQTPSDAHHQTDAARTESR